MPTKFFTNNDGNTLFNKFEGVFGNNPTINHFDSLVGYFRASGYFRIRALLEKVPKIRILVGINVDRLISEYSKIGLEFNKNEGETKKDFLQFVLDDIKSAKYEKNIEEGIAQFIEDIIDGKIELKAHPDKKIHAKVYIMRPEVFTEHSWGWVITGSSNFTDAGLGCGKNINYEFNVLLSSYDDVLFATNEFEKLWDESVPILPVDIQNLKKDSHLNNTVTPFELYIKLLIEYFGKNIDYDPDSIGDLPPKFKKLSYQIDAVNEGFNMLLRHNGFVLADVVGLGKTVIATMVAKRFLLQNGKDNTKILVVYPPAIEENWKNTFKYFDIDRYAKFITNGSLHKILESDKDYWDKEEYDLVIVDEAHKFRTHTTDAFQKLQLICKSNRINNGIIQGQQKKVILVTATPLNNRPDDILHQIELFQDSRQSTLPITNLTSFFAPLIQDYKDLKRDYSKNESKKTPQDFDEFINKIRLIYSKIRKNVIEPITIRRTRQDLENIAEYQDDINNQNIIFPKVQPPENIQYFMDKRLTKLFNKTMTYLTEKDSRTNAAIYIHYARYQAISGLKKEIQSLYYENAELVSKSLADIMKIQLVKRLESSFFAFKKSLQKFQTATLNMIMMFEKNKIYIAPDSDINELIRKGLSDNEIEEEIERLSEKNPKNRIFEAKDFEPYFINSLNNDYKFLNELVDEWEKIKDDPKLKVFLENLQARFLNKRTNVEGKLVIFSESKDTVEYLAKQLEANGRKDVLSISSENRKKLFDTICANFDANIEKQDSQYNIIITTEVLAEGINLHRSNVVIHYDTPWNSTRLIQRIGRVNRIGTKADTIYNYVFYPSAEGNAQINLNETATMKIQAFHSAFGEDNQIYSTSEILDEVKLFNIENLREEEDQRLKYLFFLRNFKKENKAWFSKIKKLPIKSRTGRDAEIIKKDELRNCTAAFLKTERKLEFYFIDNNGIPQEITPIDAFKIFEAEQSEKSQELIDIHYDHIARAVDHFDKLEYDNVVSQIEPEAAGGVAQRAKKYLNQLERHPFISDNDKIIIAKVKRLIDIGKFTNLPSDIDRLAKKENKKKKDNLKEYNIYKSLVEFISIAKKYDVHSHIDEIRKDKYKIEKPILIISESFR